MYFYVNFLKRPLSVALRGDKVFKSYGFSYLFLVFFLYLYLLKTCSSCIYSTQIVNKL